MGMTNGRTICSKHDEIMELANQISGAITEDGDETEEDKELKRLIDSSPILQEFLSNLKELADSIFVLASDAKEDGQSMESGLDNKREKIQELEKEIEDYRKYDLGYQETIKALEEELEDLKSRS